MTAAGTLDVPAEHEFLAMYRPLDGGRVLQLGREAARQGTPIGHHDLLIAAQASPARRDLGTANGREFMRVPGLACEDLGA